MSCIEPECFMKSPVMKERVVLAVYHEGGFLPGGEEGLKCMFG